MKDIMIGVDLAKSVFQIHGASMAGEVLYRKKLTRSQFSKFMANQAPALVVMEASGSAHYWSRLLESFGHAVKLIAPQYVRPFVKRQKNDAADAEAIVIAARQPEMRFVCPKSEEQQSRAVLFRSRQRLVRQRTELINALRSVMYEFGYVAPTGMVHLKRIGDILRDPDNCLPALVIEECEDLFAQIEVKTEHIEAKTLKINTLSQQSDAARRLQTIPGVGPMIAAAVEAFAPPMETFKCGRDFSAWLGLVPRQYSSGGKEKLGRVSKAGQTDIRHLLIIGAMSRLGRQGRRSIKEGSWLSRLLDRKPKMLVAIALANKMARTIWAMLTTKQDYRDPTLTAAVG